jgi:hypothetical protein
MSSFDHMQKSPHFINNGHEIDFRRYLTQEKSLLARTRGKFENRDLYTFGWGRRTCPGIHLVSPISIHLFNLLTSYIRPMFNCFLSSLMYSQNVPLSPLWVKTVT